MNKRLVVVGWFSAVLLTAATALAYTYTTQVTLKFADDVGVANNSGTLVIGNATGRQIALDDNELQARAANGGPSTLYLQNAGGLVDINADVATSGTVYAPSVDAGHIDFPGNGALYSEGDPMVVFDNLEGDRAMEFRARHSYFTGSQLRIQVDTQTTFETGPVFVEAGLALIPSAVGGTAVCMSQSGTHRFLGTCISSSRFKTDIVSLRSGLRDVMSLRPVSYTWKEGGQRDLGFVAEEAAEVRSELATRGANGEVEGFNYEHYTALLTRAVQEQQQQIEGLRGELSTSRARQAQVTRSLAASERALGEQAQKLDAQAAELAALRGQMAELARTVTTLKLGSGAQLDPVTAR